MKRTLAFLGLLLSLMTVLAVEPPVLQCVKPVSNNTQLEISWTWNNPGNVGSDIYDIYVNGTKAATLNQSAAVIVGNTRIALTSTEETYSCHIIAKNSSGTDSVRSNTLTTLNLTVTPRTIDGRDSSGALLTWPALTGGTMSASWDSCYCVYKKREFEEDFDYRSPVASIPFSNTAPSFLDTSDVCNRNISYQIGITNHISTSGSDACYFTSKIKSIKLYDNIKPLVPALDSVSVTEENTVLLGFHTTEPYMWAYIVYQDDGIGGGEYLDTVFNATQWTDRGLNPSAEQRGYKIAVLDSCNNCSNMTEEPQSNMVLASPATDACRKSAQLHWRRYANLSGGLLEYRIFLSTDGGATYRLAGTATTPEFTLEDLETGTGYRAFVRAVNQDSSITASSNRVNFSIEDEDTPDETYIRSVSVTDNAYITVKVHTTGDEYPFEKLVLQRSDDGVNFTPLAEQPYNNGAEYEFKDSTADFSSRIYYYRTCVISNDCGTSSGVSNISHNILLSGTTDAAHQCNLKWQGYEGWNGDVSHYEVLLRTEYDNSFMQLTGDLPPLPRNAYTDNVAEMSETGSKFTYCIVAKEITDSFGFEESSASNYVTLQQASTIVMPNAFTPNYDGLNEVFRPVNSFVSSEHYAFTIISRFGKTVFRTDDPASGWDGNNMDGTHAPAGVYVYIIDYMDVQGGMRQLRGSVTLLR